MTIGEQLYGDRDDMTDEEKTKGAQKVFDSVMKAYPKLKAAMLGAQNQAKVRGYTETILGRRRHHPNMQLPKFEFQPMKGYVNPDLDPLDPSTWGDNKSQIPQRIVDSLTEEFESFRSKGKMWDKIRRLQDEKIKVINNGPKLSEASRRCLNCVDFETEILTLAGWKKYSEVNVGDAILSYSIESEEIVYDNVKDIHIYPEDTNVIEFDSPSFSAVSTMDHRWVVCESDEHPRFKTTQNIYKNKWPDYPILRVGDNSFPENESVSDNVLRLIGWVLTDGSLISAPYRMELCQSTNRHKNKQVYLQMIQVLDELNIQYRDHCSDNYHMIYLNKCDLTSWIANSFPDRVLTFEFVSTLSQRQCNILMRSMLQGDGSGVDEFGERKHNSNAVFCAGTLQKRDVFQYLCYRAGYATNAREVTVESTKDYPSTSKLYDSMNNIPERHNTYYEVCILNNIRAQIYTHHKHERVAQGVWCITSNEHTWIARRNGKVYITGNSIIQGSAADQTKLAVLLLENSEEWKALGGRLLVPVHDELIAEVPICNWEEGGKLLSKLMCDAASFLPFPSKCDVTTTYRWYGREFPCPYPRPESLDTEDLGEIKWIQYHLIEMEYILPKIENEDGTKLKGDPAVGINGKKTDEYEAAIQDYVATRHITKDQFIDMIEREVTTGTFDVL